MIDKEKLYDAYDRDGFYSLQLEVGDKCNQGCIYCYMNALPDPINTIDDDMLLMILQDAQELDISAIEWLGGEPLLRDNILELLDVANDLGFFNNMWTGGLPLTDEKIINGLVENCKSGLISVHLSSITPKVYEILHDGHQHDLKMILDGVNRLIDAGYPTSRILNSVTFTGLQTAEDMIKTIDYFEEKFGIMTSLNVFHTYLRPGYLAEDMERFIPGPKEVALVYKRMEKQAGNIDLPLNCVNKQYCSSTVAVLCNGQVTPCATIRGGRKLSIHDGLGFREIVSNNRDYLIFKELKDKNQLNDGCCSCFMSDDCWGCRSRAYATGNGLLGRDPRCFRSKVG